MARASAPSVAEARATVPLTAAASGAEAVRVAACLCSLFAGGRAVQSGGEAGGERSSSKSSSALRLRSTPVPKSKSSSQLAGGEDAADEEAWKEGGASGGGCGGRPEDSSGCGGRGGSGSGGSDSRSSGGSAVGCSVRPTRKAIIPGAQGTASRPGMVAVVGSRSSTSFGPSHPVV